MKKTSEERMEVLRVVDSSSVNGYMQMLLKLLDDVDELLLDNERMRCLPLLAMMASPLDVHATCVIS